MCALTLAPILRQQLFIYFLAGKQEFRASACGKRWQDRHCFSFAWCASAEPFHFFQGHTVTFTAPNRVFNVSNHFRRIGCCCWCFPSTKTDPQRVFRDR